MCRFYDASVFETIIRVLGGMLTAHELSGDAGFLTRSWLPLLPLEHCSHYKAFRKRCLL